MQVTDDRLIEIIDFYTLKGLNEACEHFDISQETIARYLREAKERGLNGVSLSKNIRDIIANYTEDELSAIAKGGRIVPGYTKVPVISFEGQHVRVGHITDTHIGSLYFDDSRLNQAFEEFRKEKVDFITHSGDVSEGMSHRPGQIYELSELGYEKQKAKCIDLFAQWTDTPIYAISGNHDQWFIKSNGANIVGDISLALDNFHFLGHDEGDISLDGKAVLKLWHGGDGSSYALSYRLQKNHESVSLC